MKHKLFEKHQMDERQENALRKIESNSFYLMFSLLLIAIAVQPILESHGLLTGISDALGEGIVLLICAAYFCIQCIHQNLWDRKIKPTPINNIRISLIGSVLVFFIAFLYKYLIDFQFSSAIITALLGAAACFLLCIALTTLLASIYKNREQQAEEQAEE